MSKRKVVVHGSNKRDNVTSFDRPYTRIHLVRYSGASEDKRDLPPFAGKLKAVGKCRSPLNVSRTVNKSIWGEWSLVASALMFALAEEVDTSAASTSRPLMISSSAALKLTIRST